MPKHCEGRADSEIADSMPQLAPLEVWVRVAYPAFKGVEILHEVDVLSKGNTSFMYF